MIMLTKLDHTRILVGFESVKYIEETPDTLIRFLNGESLIVRESLEEVLTLAQAKRRTDLGLEAPEPTKVAAPKKSNQRSMNESLSQ